MSCEEILADGGLPRWQELVGRYPEERDCLAGYLAYKGAEVLDGSKPANLFTLYDQPLPCGRNLWPLWERHAESLLGQLALASEVLRERDGRKLILLYRPLSLQRILLAAGNRRLLEDAGYAPGEGLPASLARLRRKLQEHPEFPHEIGLFLGYPLKDVAAFMGLADLPFACQGPWRIYGAPESSLQLAEAHARSRQRVVRSLLKTADPLAAMALRATEKILAVA